MLDNYETLNNEEVEQVGGGAGTTITNCPHCHKYVTAYVNGNQLTCSVCGQSWQIYC